MRSYATANRISDPITTFEHGCSKLGQKQKMQFNSIGPNCVYGLPLGKHGTLQLSNHESVEVARRNQDL